MALRTAVEDGRLGRIGHISTHGYTPDYEGRALADHMSLANENSDGQRWPVTAAEARSALRVALAVDRSLALERPVAVAEMG